MNITRHIPAWLCFFMVSMAASVCIPAARSQDQVLSITVEPNQGIRDISAKYLNDPNLWEDILTANGMKTADQVAPGMTLSIPVQAISQANSSLEAATRLIQQATENGATRFAIQEIERAVTVRDQSIEKRKAGLWAECTKLANTASGEAEKALEISLKKQNVAVNAIVDYCHGDVHRRKTDNSLWESISMGTAIEEGEAVRTLARSYAHLLFSDNGRFKLGENSQARIRENRADLLSDTLGATISVIKGDLSALLTGGKKGNRFEVDIPGVRTNIESKQFFVRIGEKETALVANYDEGKLEIKAQGETVVLGKNQGSVVRKNQKPSKPTDLLPSPRLLEPADKSERFNTDIVMAWENIPGAQSYLLQLSDEETFSKLLWEETVPAGKEEPSSDTVRAKFPSLMGAGTFYWRVSSVSADELPGPPGSPGYFRVIKDSEPPYLVILSPDQGASVTEAFAEISGNTEKDAAVTIQDQAVKTDAAGEFRFSCDLSEGENRVVIKATDRAGNVNSLERTISRVTGGESDLSFDSSLPRAGKNHFLLKNKSFSLAGKTWPRALVSVRHFEKEPSEEKQVQEFSASAVADAEGRFQINVRAPGNREEFTITVISPAGRAKTDRFITEIDDEPPAIRFSSVLSSPTAQKKLLIEGETEGAASLRLNGTDIPLTASESKPEIRNPISLFSFPFELKPGKNFIRLEARDTAGNIRVFEKEILSDSDAPVLAGYDLSPKKAKGGDEVRLTVRVRDATDIKKIAPFEVIIGESDYAGQMLRSDTREEYVGVFRVPGKISGTVKLRSLTLSDYLGNTKKYDF